MRRALESLQEQFEQATKERVEGLVLGWTCQCRGLEGRTGIVIHERSLPGTCVELLLIEFDLGGVR